MLLLLLNVKKGFYFTLYKGINWCLYPEAHEWKSLVDKDRSNVIEILEKSVHFSAMSPVSNRLSINRRGKHRRELTDLSMRPFFFVNYHNKSIAGSETVDSMSACNLLLRCREKVHLHTHLRCSCWADHVLVLPSLDSCRMSSCFCVLHSEMISMDSPISINEAGVDVIGALHPSDWQQADAGGLERHDVHQAILEFVTRQVGTDESWGMCFRVGQFLQRQRRHVCLWCASHVPTSAHRWLHSLQLHNYTHRLHCLPRVF